MGTETESKEEPTVPEEKAVNIHDILIQIEQRKAVISYQRDKLYEIQEYLTDVLESMDSGIEGLEDSLDSLKLAVDSLSEKV